MGDGCDGQSDECIRRKRTPESPQTGGVEITRLPLSPRQPVTEKDAAKDIMALRKAPCGTSAAWDPHLPQDMCEEVKEALSRLGLSELRRPTRPKDKPLDRQTTEYIHRKLDSRDNGDTERLAGLRDVVQTARTKAHTSRYLLQQSKAAVDSSVHTLRTFLQAPTGWFRELCVGHEMLLPLTPTFPSSDPCEEVRQAATETLYLQLCVDEFHVPAQLIVREMMVKKWGEGHGEGVSEPDTAQTSHCGPVSEDPRVSQNTISPMLVLSLSSASSESAQLDRVDKLIPTPYTTEFHFKYQSKTAGELKTKQARFHKATAAHHIDLKNRERKSCSLGEQSSATRIVSCNVSYPYTPVENIESCEEINSNKSVTIFESGSDFQQESSVMPGSACSPGLSNATATSSIGPSDLSQLSLSCVSVQVDPMSFTSYSHGKDTSHNATATASTPCLQHSTSEDMETIDVEHSSLKSSFPARRHKNSPSSTRIGESRESIRTNDTKQAPTEQRDVRIVRESKEASVPEISGKRAFVRGQYAQRDTEHVLPFMLFVHMEHSATHRQPGPTTLCGSYVRKMLTANKNLRWRFHHTIGEYPRGKSGGMK